MVRISMIPRYSDAQHARGTSGESIVMARGVLRSRAVVSRAHGTRAPWAWSWSDPAARDTRIHTRADGTGGEPIERWATAHGAVTVDVIAVDVGAASSESNPSAMAGPDPEQAAIFAAFRRELGFDADRVRSGAPGGDPLGRTGPDVALGGTGPGGPQARAGGDHEGSETRGASDGARYGSSLGVEGGSERGRYGGVGKPGDNGVRMAGAIAGGVIAVPAAIKGVVEILLLADAGDVTGMGAELFTTLARRAASMSAAALRELVASEARAVALRSVEAPVGKLARSPRWLALSVEERLRAMQIAFNEQTRRFFRGFGRAARDAEGTAARIGTEAAEVEPVTGRLPRNHQYAGSATSAAAAASAALAMPTASPRAARCGCGSTSAISAASWSASIQSPVRGIRRSCARSPARGRHASVSGSVGTPDAIGMGDPVMLDA